MVHNYVYVSCGIHAYVYAYIYAYVSFSHSNYSTKQMQCIKQTQVARGANPFNMLIECI